MHDYIEEDDDFELNKMLVNTVPITGSTTIADVKELVISSCRLKDVKADELICASVRGGKVEKYHRNLEKAIDIDDSKTYTFFF